MNNPRTQRLDSRRALGAEGLARRWGLWGRWWWWGGDTRDCDSLCWLCVVRAGVLGSLLGYVLNHRCVCWLCVCVLAVHDIVLAVCWLCVGLAVCCLCVDKHIANTQLAVHDIVLAVWALCWVGCVLPVCWLCVGCVLAVCWLCVGWLLALCWLYVGCVGGVFSSQPSRFFGVLSQEDSRLFSLAESPHRGFEPTHPTQSPHNIF